MKPGGLIAESLQSYGGYGYCEDYPAVVIAKKQLENLG